MKTGVFESPKEPEEIFTINIGGGRQIKYRSAYELGRIVASNGIQFPNPYDPINTEYEDFHEGYYRGKSERKAQQGASHAD